MENPEKTPDENAVPQKKARRSRKKEKPTEKNAMPANMTGKDTPIESMIPPELVQQLQNYFERIVVGVAEKEVNKTHIKNILSEYFKCSCLLGYDVNGDISVLWNTTTAQDNDSLETLLMNTCQQIAIAKNVRQHRREQQKNRDENEENS